MRIYATSLASKTDFSPKCKFIKRAKSWFNKREWVYVSIRYLKALRRYNPRNIAHGRALASGIASNNTRGVLEIKLIRLSELVGEKEAEQEGDVEIILARAGGVGGKFRDPAPRGSEKSITLAPRKLPRNSEIKRARARSRSTLGYLYCARALAR